MTETDYRVGLSYLRERAPNHALLASIEVKYGIVQCAYLARALKDLPKMKPKQKPDKVITGDTRYDDLQQKKKDLFTQRKKLSNKFQKMVNVADRVSNSKAIQEIQYQIERVMMTIQYFEDHKELPLESDPYDLPKEPLLIRKRLNSYIQSRSRLRKEIRLLSSDYEKNEKTIHNKESKVADYDIKIEYVRKAIAAGI